MRLAGNHRDDSPPGPGVVAWGCMRGARVTPMALAELLLAVSLGLVLLTMSYQALSLGWRSARCAVSHAHNRQEVSRLLFGWRRLVHNTTPEDWRCSTDGRFDARVCSLAFTDGELVMTDAAGRRRWPVPRGASVAFAVERSASGTAAAVLTLAWEEAGPIGRTREAGCRLVACARSRRAARGTAE